MKKTLLAAATLSLLVTSGAAFADTASNTSNGSVNFVGEVTNAACSMAAVEDVNLGSVTVRNLTKAKDSGLWGSTTIKYHGCELGTGSEGAISGMTLTVAVGTADAKDANLWPNAGGSAENVGVEVTIDGRPVIPADGLVTIEKKFGTAKTMSYNVRGRMVATGAAKAGDVKVNLPFVADFL